MHVPRIETRTLDETVEAVDLGQTPADVVFLSFSDSDLNALARAYDAFPEPKPTLRIASLAALRHPFSVDLYLERVCAHARLVVVRVKGYVEVAGKAMRMLVQGVGERFRRDFDRPWGVNEARQSRLVVIAQKGVDREAVAAALGA